MFDALARGICAGLWLHSDCVMAWREQPFLEAFSKLLEPSLAAAPLVRAELLCVAAFGQVDHSRASHMRGGVLAGCGDKAVGAACVELRRQSKAVTPRTVSAMQCM